MWKLKQLSEEEIFWIAGDSLVAVEMASFALSFASMNVF